MNVLRATQNAVVIAGALFLAREASAEELQGRVRVVGSAVSQKVILAEEGSKAGPSLCRNDLAKRVGKLTGMTVLVTGGWEKNDKGEAECLSGIDFSILKTTSGRPAMVGILSQKDGTFLVTGEDGKIHKLADVPAGLKQHEGKKVVIDVKTMAVPGVNDASNKVVSYGTFPD